MGKLKRFAPLLTVLLLMVLLPAHPALSQVGQEALQACSNGGFSTEEDFLSNAPEPPDGNPIISDGDLLAADGTVCARNADLLVVFRPKADLGLDAVDIIDVDNYLVAFSTELDDPFGQFTAGDLLTTHGAVIPNVALVAAFDVNYDIGLDALHFVGDPDVIVAFLDRAKELGRDFWLENPGALADYLREFGIDLWFSTEGTPPPVGQPPFLDGDLLSALGFIVAGNDILLPPVVPAGIPDRGVDFGLDAFTALARDTETARERGYFSTEILYDSPEDGLSFNDGDVLLVGNGVVIPHQDLIRNFLPAADFLGLDALSFPPAPPPQEPNIQTMCGDRSTADFDGGVVLPGGPGTGLYRENSDAMWPAGRPRRPCGEFVPMDGFLPSSGVERFRVAYRPAGDPVPPVGTALGIETRWRLREWRWFPVPGCYLGPWLNTAGGWMDASDYLDAKNGILTGCTNPGLRLAVWDTNDRMGLGPADKDGHYVLWLEWEDGASVLHKEPFEHHLQLDNTLPEIAPYPDGLQVRLLDGTTIVPACGEAEAGVSEFQVWGQFDDDYYWNFRLQLRGGRPPASVGYGPHNYYDPDDGPPGLKNTDETGTMPDGTTVHLRNINMTDLGRSFVQCCYVLDLWVRDAAIRHSFNNRVANDNSGSLAWQANAFVTFAAGP